MKNKKNTGKKYDFEDEEYGDEFSPGSKDEQASLLEQFSTYQEIKVSQTTEDVLVNAQKLISGLSKVYLNHKIIDDDYRNSIGAIELDNLAILMKQTKYAEHMVDTLMRRLDNGGYADKGIFLEVRKLQDHLLYITKEVSVHIRQLPEYFKFIESDSKTSETNENVFSNNVIEATIEQHKELPNHTDDLFDFMGTPQRGTRDLMLTLTDSFSEIDNKLENMPDIELSFDPSEINEDEDDEKSFEDLLDNYKNDEEEDFEI